MRTKSEDLQTIDFNELVKGDVFRFTGRTKLHTVTSRNRSTISFCEVEDISGFHEKKKTCKLTVQINTCMQTSEADYIEFLNDLGTPAADLKINGGRVPSVSLYGKWLKRNDRIAFKTGFREFARS